MDPVSDETLKSLNHYAASSFQVAPPPFLQVSGDVLYALVCEVQAWRCEEPDKAFAPGQNVIRPK